MLCFESKTILTFNVHFEIKFFFSSMKNEFPLIQIPTFYYIYKRYLGKLNEYDWKEYIYIKDYSYSAF